MRLTNEIFGVDFDFDDDDVLKFCLLVEDDENWIEKKQKMTVDIIPQLISLLEKVAEHARLKRKSTKVWRQTHAFATIENGLVRLYLNPDTELEAFDSHWATDMLTLFRMLKAVCLELSIEF